MRNSKKLTRIVILGVILGIISISATGYAFAANVSGTGDLTAAVPNNGPKGQTVTLEAANGEYHTGDIILVTITGSASSDISGGSITVNATGGFKGTATIPADATVNTDTITTTDANGNAGSTGFTVTTPVLDTASPASGPIGQTVSINFNHFISGVTATVSIHGTAVTESPVTVNSTGGFAGTVTVATGTSLGAGNLVVSDGTNSQSTSFAVTTPAIDTASPTNGPVGQTVAVNFNNLIANHAYTIKFGATTASGAFATGTTNSTGGLAGSVTVPSISAGSQPLSVTDGTNTPQTAFTVTKPSIVLVPTQGPNGISLAVTGTNMLPSKSVTIKFNNNAITLSPVVKTDTTGSFIALFSVPSSALAGNNNIVAATDGTNTPVATFTGTTTLLPAIPSTGPLGGTVELQGNHFISSHAITFKIGTTALVTSPSTVTSNSSGGFDITATIPSTGTSPLTIIASDTFSSPTTAYHLTTPSFSLNSTDIVNGTGLNMTGTGFIPSHSITVKFGTVAYTNSPINTDSTGRFSVIITVPNLTPASSVTVSATDSVNAASVTPARIFAINLLSNLGDGNGTAFAVNMGGQIVGVSEFSNGTTNAVFWTPTTHVLTNLGTSINENASHAFGINTAGQIVGDSGFSNGTVHAVTWASTGGHSITDLGTSVGALPGGTSGSSANSIQSVAIPDIVGYNANSTVASVPILWHKTGVTYTATVLPTFTGATTGSATWINTAGTIAGYSNSGLSDFHALVWTGTTHAKTDLGTLTGGTLSQAFGINTAGVVVGLSDDTSANEQAVIWTPSGVSYVIRGLGFLSGGSFSEGLSINDAGDVVGKANDAQGNPHAVIWIKSGSSYVIHDLGRLATDSTAVANDGGPSGNLIVGSSDVGPNTHAVFWTRSTP